MHRDFKLYLDDIIQAINWIYLYVADMDFAHFSNDQKTMDAVVRNLEIIGEAAHKLPENIKEVSAEIEWRKIIGLRNILIHEYFGVNKPVLWDIVQNKLRPLKSVCEKLLELEF